MGTNLCHAQSVPCDKHFHLKLSFAGPFPLFSRLESEPKLLANASWRAENGRRVDTTPTIVGTAGPSSEGSFVNGVVKI